ncbi:MAG TPA: DUF2267 domain-containing protein [Micromonosporaceae bacterium]
MTHRPAQPLDHALQRSAAWLQSIAEEFETEDTDFIYRVTRAWLHAVRDRLPVAESAHLAAQLPELLRGVYYEGWKPTVVPIKLHVTDFVDQVAAEAHVSTADVPKILWAVSDVLGHRISNFGAVLDRMPADIRALLKP